MSTVIEGTFTATAQESPTRNCTDGDRIIVLVDGTWTGAIRVCAHLDGTTGEITLGTIVASGVYEYIIPKTHRFVHLHAAMISSGTAVWRLENANEFTEVGDEEWDDLRFPAQGINPTGLTAGADVETTEDGFPGALLFDAALVELAAGNAQIPHGWILDTPLRPHIHWSKTTSAAGNVIWHFYYRFLNRHGAPDDWVGPIVGAQAVPTGDVAGSEGIVTFGEITTTGRTPSFNVHWRLYRKADDGSDTYAADARLHELDFHYQKNSLGTGAEFIK